MRKAVLGHNRPLESSSVEPGIQLTTIGFENARGLKVTNKMDSQSLQPAERTHQLRSESSAGSSGLPLAVTEGSGKAEGGGASEHFS